MRALILLMTAAAAGPAWALSGVVTRVSDGDTVWVKPDDAPKRKPVKVRLVGIDAPERCQPWGAEATAALTARVLHERVEVPTRGVDAHGRVLGGLRLADGSDVAAWMVSQGRPGARDSSATLGPTRASSARRSSAASGCLPMPRRWSRGCSAACTAPATDGSVIQRCTRISVLLPNRLSIRSTASTAVLLRTSSAGFSSITSNEASRPVSAIISMHSCASR
ncbi:hypothetical protein FSC37_01695 [Piscinibacter aquaticus]|uniref:TNase-like domain-containing protein n=1 Tax=Piscinibacter aquaticus TaxID=392597 RepID=A0A5C6U0G2_9BURK|nr:hypothetical protein FSC37_01695 [Piscinibacter aquaticus]